MIVVNEQEFKAKMGVKVRRIFRTRVKEVKLTIQYQVKIEVSKSWGTKSPWYMVYICSNGVRKAPIGHKGM